MSTLPRAAPGKQNPAARAQYEMGRQFLAMERPEEALRAFAAALALDPSQGEVRTAIDEVEQKFGATPEALGIAIPAAAAVTTETPEPEPAPPVEPVSAAPQPSPTMMTPPSAPLEPAPLATGTTAATTTRPGTASVVAIPSDATAPVEVAPPETVTTSLTSPTPASTPSVAARVPATVGHPASGAPIRRGRRFPMLPLLMAGVFSCLMFFLLKRRLGA